MIPWSELVTGGTLFLLGILLDMYSWKGTQRQYHPRMAWGMRMLTAREKKVARLVSEGCAISRAAVIILAVTCMSFAAFGSAVAPIQEQGSVLLVAALFPAGNVLAFLWISRELRNETWRVLGVDFRGYKQPADPREQGQKSIGQIGAFLMVASFMYLAVLCAKL